MTESDVSGSAQMSTRGVFPGISERKVQTFTQPHMPQSSFCNRTCSTLALRDNTASSLRSRAQQFWRHPWKSEPNASQKKCLNNRGNLSTIASGSCKIEFKNVLVVILCLKGMKYQLCVYVYWGDLLCIRVIWPLMTVCFLTHTVFSASLVGMEKHKAEELQHPPFVTTCENTRATLRFIWSSRDERVVWKR